VSSGNGILASDDEPTRVTPDQVKPGFFRTILTEDNANKVWDTVRVLGVGGMAGFLALAGYSVVVRHAPLNLQDLGVGVAAIIGATGGGLNLKKRVDA
jgi:hypothetical protein